MDGKCLRIQTDKPAAPAELRDIIYLADARNCATQRGALVDNMARCAVMCDRMQVLATLNCLILPMIAWTEDAARCYPISR